MHTLWVLVIGLVAELFTGQAIALNALERDGLALYSGRETGLLSTVQGAPLPAALAACGRCHGPDGQGTQEAGQIVPPIGWSALRQTRRGLAAFADEAAVLAAIERGIGRESRPVGAGMPRFELQPHQREALLAYLKALGSRQDRAAGVHEDRIDLVSLLPISGPRSGTASAILEGLNEAFGQVNRDGGIFGRRLQLTAIDVGSTGEHLESVLREQSRSPRFAAAVGSLIVRADNRWHGAWGASPGVLFATLGLPRKPSTQPRLTYLLPALSSQIAMAQQALAAHCPQSVVVASVAETDASRGLLSTEEADTLGVGVRGTVSSLMRAWATDAGWLILSDSKTLGAIDQSILRVRPPQCLATLATVSGDFATLRATRAQFEIHPIPRTASLPAESAAVWRTMARWSATLFVELLARAGPELTDAAIQSAASALGTVQLAPGVTVAFSAERLHAFGAGHIYRTGE